MEDILWYHSPANAFEEALPLGNGVLGAMVYGKTDTERLSLNLDTLWSGKPRQYTMPNAPDALHRARKLVLSGEIERAERILEQEFCGPWTQSYLPMGDLWIDLPCGTATDYRRTLDLSQGIATTIYQIDSVTYCRECFISAPAQGLFLRLSSSAPCDYRFSLSSQLKHTVHSVNEGILLSGEALSDIAPSYAKGDRPEEYDGEGIKFAVLLSAKTDGVLQNENGRLTITGCREATVCLFAATSFRAWNLLPDADPTERAWNDYSKCNGRSYDALLQEHMEDHRSLYDRVSLQLSCPPDPRATDLRLAQGYTPGLALLLFNFGRYLMIAASRQGSRATNLQGIWNEELYAPWSSNYTVNINTQMNYWPVLPCNLPECAEPLTQLICEIAESGKRTAWDYYHAPGFVSHHNIDLWAHTTPVGNRGNGCLSYAFWNLSSGWLCRHLYEYYEYTNDLEFLRSVAYPILKSASEFYLSQLTETDKGYILCPSTSPENRYKWENSSFALASHTAMSQSILAELFQNCVKTARILDLDPAFADHLATVQDRLVGLSIGPHGELVEFDAPWEETDPHHRHVSHLYGLYPGESITPLQTPQLANACVQTLLDRGDESTGWSMGWKVNLWARLYDGNHALKLVKDQLTLIDITKVHYHQGGGTYKNLFDAHPPFQIDGNFGVVAGICQFFLQCTDNELKLLPALPSEWADGEVHGLLAKGNITVSIVWKKGQLCGFTLKSPISQTVRVRTPHSNLLISLSAGAPYHYQDQAK